MDFSKVDDYILHTLHEQRKVPCCDVKIMQNHKELHRFACGTSDYCGQKPVDGTELYNMYSCSKPVTVTAALRLWEDGKIDLDAPVSDYLPEWKDAYLLEDGKRIAPHRPALVKNLFTMSAGLDYDFYTAPTMQLLKDTSFNAGTRDIVRTFVQRPLSYHPGEKYQYSLCHDTIGALIEAVSGMLFGDYCRKVIFDPLGMKDTTFKPNDEQNMRIAAQFTSVEHEPKPVSIGRSHQLTPDYESGGGGLISSVDDYSRFADAMSCGGVTDDGYRILKPETIEMLHTEHLSKIAPGAAFSCAAGPNYGYGLGVRTLMNHNGGERSPIGEFGWDGAAGSYVMMDAQNHISIFFAMHVLSWPNIIGYGLENDVGLGHGPIRDYTYETLGL